MADSMTLVGELPLGCEQVQRSLGGVSSLPQASPCLPQRREREEREGGPGQEQEAFLVLLVRGECREGRAPGLPLRLHGRLVLSRCF